MYSSNSAPTTRAAMSLPELIAMKRSGRKIVCLTAYDASFARAMDRVGIDLVLVGDSLGMVVQGHGSTLPVSLRDMCYHSACVAKGLQSALLMADLPFQSYASPAQAHASATQLMAEGGASVVKLEGAGVILESIRYLADRDIPVCAHLGLTPQSVTQLGGFKVQGRDEASADRLMRQAVEVQAAGASLLVLECIPATLATEISAMLTIPTIGIGAGPGCDGQVLVMHDLLGLAGRSRRPRFVRNFLQGRDSIDAAFEAYANDVREGRFPAAEHIYQ
jgi:3-methyl-2-oxobutanoate hydroxymethyltransferase